MKRFMLFAMLALGGCQTPAEQPDQTTVLAGDYQAVASCFYQRVAAKSGYRKTDTPSAQTSTVEGSSGGRSADKIEFIATGDGITKVHAQLGSPGPNEAWAGYLSILKQCEETVAGS